MRRVIRTLSFASMLALLLTSMATAPVAAAGEVAVSINVVSEIAANSDFTATVTITQVTNLDALNYNVSFNPAALRLDNVTNGNIGSSIVPVEIFNQKSTGIFTILQNVPGLAGVSGSGYLAVLHFHVIGSSGESSAISLSDGVLSDNAAQEIQATWTGASIRVISGVSSSGGSMPPPPSPPSPTETTTNPPATTTTVPGATTTEPAAATITPPETTTAEPAATITQPEATYGKEQSPTIALSPESETTGASATAPNSTTSTPAVRVGLNWPVLGVAIGGGTVVIGLIIFFLIRGMKPF